MGFKEYNEYDALGLAELVRKKEVSAEELLDEAINRNEKVNDKTNAVVLKHYDEAKEMIKNGLPEGLFTGVPYLLKDLHVLLTGTKTTFGSKFFKDYTADHNSTLVDRYLAAGLVIFGKTNSPEFGATACWSRRPGRPGFVTGSLSSPTTGCITGIERGNFVAPIATLVSD